MINSLLMKAAITKTKVVCDVAFSVASIVCVPSMFLLGAYWMTQPGSFTKVSNNSNSVINVAKGSQAVINTSIQMKINAKKLLKMNLLDNRGNIVHSYPSMVVDDQDEESPEFGNIVLTVPKNLPSGNYSLVADVEYPKNPLKTNTLQVDLAHISVDDPPQ